MSRFWRWLRGQPLVAAVAAVQLAVLLAAFLYARQGGTPLSFKGSDLVPVHSEVAVRDGCLVIPDGTSDVAAVTLPTTLAPGMYTLTVTYQGGGDTTVALWAEGVFYGDTLPLAAGVGSENGTFFLPLSTVREATLAISNNSNGAACTIEGLTLTPSHAFGWYVLLRGLALFLLVDMVWLLGSRRLVLPGGPAALTTLLGVCAIAVLATMPLLGNVLPYGHDLSFHLNRIEGLAQGLANGQFPVRIQPYWLQGRGYAVSLFYGDLFLYFPALLRFFGVPLHTAYTCYVAAVNLATAAVCDWVLYRMLKNRWVALAGSGLYTLSLYRLIDLYTRAAVGEYTAMIFLPLVFYGLWRVFAQENENRPQPLLWLPAAIGFSGLLLTHVLTCEMVGLLTILACLVLLRRTLRKNTFFSLCKVVLGTVVLNLWWVVPFLESFGGDYLFHKAGSQDTLGGYGAFAAQLFTLFARNNNLSGMVAANEGISAEIPMGIGLALLAGALLFVLCAIWRQGTHTPLDRLGSFALWGGALCILFSSIAFPWDSLTGLHPLLQSLFGTIQFVWRFLSPATWLWVVAACCGLVLVWKRSDLRVLALAAVCGLTLITWGYFTESTLINLPAIGRLNSNDIMGAEYLPTGVNKALLYTPRSVTADEGVTLRDTVLGSGLSAQVSCAAPAGGGVRVPLVAYPYYQAIDDDTAATLPLGHTDDSWELAVLLPAGYDGSFTVSWREPWHWRLAELLSVLAWAALGLWRRRRRQSPVPRPVK